MTEPRAPDWTALTHSALLQYANGGDAEEALVLLRRRIAAQGREMAIGWRAPELTWHWVDTIAPPFAPPDFGFTSAAQRCGDLHWWLPLEHLSEPIGLVWLSASAAEAAASFEPLAAACAALVARARHADQAVSRAETETLRNALRSAGTFTWQWLPGSDELLEVDEGFAMLGYPPGHLPPDQRGWDTLIHPDDRQANEDAYQRHLRGETEQYEHVYRALAADGSWRWLHERGRIVERAADGSPRRMLGTQLDVTRWRELEAASREAETAQAANRAKSLFLSRVSHELRTPLNAVLGFAQLLEMGAQPPLARAHERPVRLIREAGEHLLALINDLLDLSLIEAGQIGLRMEPVALRPLVQGCESLLQAAAMAAGVAIELDLPEHLSVRADATRLKQVMLNLMANAIKYNREGGRVRVHAQADGDEVAVEVRDTGQGIAAEHLEHVFQPFHRGAHQRSPIEGSGVGLAVTRSLVEAMQGRIDVTSTPGAGSVFRVRLPSAAQSCSLPA